MFRPWLSQLKRRILAARSRRQAAPVTRSALLRVEELEVRRVLFNGTINVWNVNTSGNWSTAADWSLGHVPLPTDPVSLPAGSGGDYTVTFDVGSTTIKALTIDATLAFPGSSTLSITGPYTQGSDGTLMMTDSDQLATGTSGPAGNNASLAGTLTITSASSSSLGSSTRLLTFPSVSGNFSTVNLPTAPSNSALHTYLGADRFQLLATSPDATVFWVNDTPSPTSPTEWFDTTGTAYWANDSGTVSSPDAGGASANDKVFIGNFAGNKLGVIYDTSIETFSSSTVASVTSLLPIIIKTGTLEVTGDFQAESTVVGGTALDLQGGTLQLHEGTVTAPGSDERSWGIVVDGGELKNATVDASTTIKGTTSGGTLSNVTINGTLNLDQQNGTTLTVADVLSFSAEGQLLLGSTGSSPTSATLQFTTEVTTIDDLLNGTVILGDSFSNRINIIGSQTLYVYNATIRGGTGVLTGDPGSSYVFQGLGTLSAESSGETITIFDHWSAITNGLPTTGIIQAKNGGSISSFSLPSNYDSNSQTLTDGQWNVYGSGSRISVSGMNVQTNDATILLDGGGMIVGDTLGGSALADLATNNGSLTVQNGETLTVADDFTNQGNLTVDGSGSVLTAANSFRQANGTLALTHGGVIASDSIDTSGGSFDLAGASFEAGAGTTTPSLTIDAGVTVTISGLVNTNINRSVYVNGTLDYLSGELNVNGGTVYIDNGGLFLLETSAFFFVDGGIEVESGGTFHDTFNGTQTVFGLTNDAGGTVEVDSGTLELGRGGSSAGVFDVNSGASLEQVGSPYSINAGATFTGGGSLIVGNDLEVNTSFTVPTLVNDGTINVNSGTLEVQGGSTNDGSAGTGSAAFNVSQGATLLFDTGTFTVQGTTTFSGAGLVQIGNNGEFTVNSDISIPDFEVDTGAVVDGSNALTVGVNSGLFNWYGGVLDIFSTIVDASGTMTVTGSDNKTLNGALTSNGTLNFNDRNFVGTGRVTISNGQVNVNADVSITNFELDNGTVSGSNSLTLAVNSGTFTWSGGTLGPASASIDASGTLNLSTLVPIGIGPVPTLATTLTNNGTTNLSSFSAIYASGPATFINAEGANFNVGTGGFSGFIFQGLTFQNAGTFTSNSLGNQSNLEASSFDNQITGVFHLVTGNIAVSGFPGIGGASFTNSGTVEIESGTVLDVFPPFFGPTSLTQTGGSTDLEYGGAIVADTGFDVSGGSLMGTGTITGNVTLSGNAILSPGHSPGIYNINGNLTLGSGTTTVVQIAGTDESVPQYDQVNVTGAITFGGTLQIERLNPNNFTTDSPLFDPSGGDVYSIFTYATHRGSFASITGQDLSTASSDPENVYLYAAFESSGLNLLAANEHFVTNTNTNGSGSLQQAILDTNSEGVLGITMFQLDPGDPNYNSGTGLWTIFPGRASQNESLPEIDTPLILDATTQAGYNGTPLVDINGTNAFFEIGFPDMPFSEGSDGIDVATTGSVIRGLEITSFRHGADAGGSSDSFGGGYGIVLEQGADDTTIDANYIGTDGIDTLTGGNSFDGVFVRSSDNQITNNVISGNTGDGIRIFGGSNNILTGNRIGVGADGVAAVGGNQGDGILLELSSHNRIGTDGSGIDDAADRNIIGDSGVYGIEIISGSNYNVVAGNYVGVGSDGLTAVGNGIGGVVIDEASYNRVGVLSNDPGEGNVIANNSGDGVFLADLGTTDNIIAGNIIGLAADGVTAAPNTAEGIVLFAGPSYNRIGTYDNASANAAQRNIISGNTGSGIELYSGGTATVGNTIAGNYIGTDQSGTTAVPNSFGGIWVRDGVTATVIGTAGGSTNALARNVISGNAAFGVDIDPVLGAAMYTLVSGNFIGTTADGLSALPNDGNGVIISNSNDNVIGVPGAGSFRPYGDFGTDAGPQSAAVGDLNGDGIPDLVTANYAAGGGSTVSVLLGNGDGSFLSAVSYSVGVNPFTGNPEVPYAVAVGDLNGDTIPDIITANTDGTVSVLLGIGNGNFQTAQLVFVGHQLTGIAVGDFTGSGEVDVAVADHGALGGGLALLRGFTPAAFGDIASFAHNDSISAADGYDAIVMGDFNHDGKVDIAAVSTLDNIATIVLGNTSDSLVPIQNASTSDLTGNPTDPNGIAVGDFNHDGRLDLATSDSNGRVSVLFGQGDGTFFNGVIHTVSTTNQVQGIVAGDFNGDGMDDLAVRPHSESQQRGRICRCCSAGVMALSEAS